MPTNNRMLVITAKQHDFLGVLGMAIETIQ
jgi:hypothetical protein